MTGSAVTAKGVASGGPEATEIICFRKERESEGEDKPKTCSDGGLADFLVKVNFRFSLNKEIPC